MSIKQAHSVAVLAIASAMTISVAAQDLAIRTTVADGHTVFVLPSGESAPVGASSLGGVDITVSEAFGVRSYRAGIGARTYTAHVDATGSTRWLVFSPARQRFEALSGTVRVELAGQFNSRPVTA